MPTIFLDTPILRRAFVESRKKRDWRTDFKLPPDVHLITAHKCIAEMYGILKTSILDTELKEYGCESSRQLRERVFEENDFLNIFWHHQVLENLTKNIWDTGEGGRRLRAAVEWRECYERVRSDFDSFLRNENIEYVQYVVLFANSKWQIKFNDLAIETLIPSEDLEIVLAAWFAQSGIFLTDDRKLIRLSFSLPLEPGIPAFSTLEDLERKLAEKEQGVVTFPSESEKQTHGR